MSPDAPRVVVASDAVSPFHRGGKETRYRELLCRLRQNGVNASVATMHWWDGPDPVIDAVPYRAVSPHVELYRSGRRSIAQALVYALGCLRLLRWPIDVLEADHMPYIPLFALWFVAKVRRVPLVVTWHEVWGRSYWVEYAGPVTGTVGAVLERLAIKLPTRIVAVSETTAQRLLELGVPQSRISVITAGVDHAEIADVDAHDDTAELVCVGRLIDHKRVDVALRSLAALLIDGWDLRLDVIGDGPDRELLEKLAADLGIASRVRFLGTFAEPTDVWARIKGAQVAVLPSEREGFGLVVAEALSAGVPVVCSDHHDNEARFLVEDGMTGSVVPAGDAGAFSQAIEHWLDRNNDPSDVTSAFHHRHPSLCWDAMAEQYAALYKELAR